MFFGKPSSFFLRTAALQFANLCLEQLSFYEHLLANFYFAWLNSFFSNHVLLEQFFSENCGFQTFYVRNSLGFQREKLQTTICLPNSFLGKLPFYFLAKQHVFFEESRGLQITICLTQLKVCFGKPLFVWDFFYKPLFASKKIEGNCCLQTSFCLNNFISERHVETTSGFFLLEKNSVCKKLWNLKQVFGNHIFSSQFSIQNPKP